MSTFDHKMFLWNKDHSFKDYKNQEILIEDLAEFLGCELASVEEKIKVNKENLLVPTKNLRIIKTGYLIVAKDKDGKIIVENLDELEIEPISIKEINFGGPLDKSFKYTTEDLPGVQDLQESAQALKVTGNPKKVEPADTLKLQNFTESFVEDSDTEDSNTNNCYWAKLSSFSGGSNGSNKLLEFLSGPNKTIVQTAPKQFFISDNEMNGGTHYHTQGIMNGGTNGPSLIGITYGNEEMGVLENNVFKYENQEFLLPRGGQIVRVFRQPAEDLTLPEKLIYNLDNLRLDQNNKCDPQDFFGDIPTVYQGVPDTRNKTSHFARVYTKSGDTNEGYRVQLSTKAGLYYPGIEMSSKTEYDAQHNQYSASRSFLQYCYTQIQYTLKQLYDGSLNNPRGWAFGYWYEKVFKDNDEGKPESGDSQCVYTAQLSFPATQMISLEDLLSDNTPTSIQPSNNHLIIKNYQHQYPIETQTTISEDRVDLLFKPIKKYYRTCRDREGKTLAGTTNCAINLLLLNFCLYPGEKLQQLIQFKPEVQSFHGRTWSENVTNHKNKKNSQNNYLGLAIKMYGKPRLINKDTSEFLYPSDCRDKPTISVTLGNSQGLLEQFQRWGCGDLLTHRITSLSCLVLFDDEKYVGSNRFEFKDCSYKKQDDNPVLLGTKTMSPADAPANNSVSSLAAPLFYWPSMADTTKVLTFDYNKDGAGNGENLNTGPISGWYQLESHSEFAGSEECGYRKIGQDKGAVVFFVEPDATKSDFNLSNVYGWYGIDNSIHVNIKFDENVSHIVAQVTNYSLSEISFQLGKDETKFLDGLTFSEGNVINSNTTLFINNKLAFNINNPTDYQGLGKIKPNNQVYKDNILYGEGTEEGIQPYENE